VAGGYAPFRRAHGLTLFLVGVGAAALVFHLNIRPAAANLMASRAVAAAKDDQFAQAMESFQQSLGVATFGSYEIRHVMAQYLLTVGSTTEERPAELIEALQLAIREVKQNTRLHPYDHIPLLTLARLHMILSRELGTAEKDDAALAYAVGALRIAPAFVPAYHDVAQAFLLRDAPDKAYRWLEQAQALNPALGLNHWLLGVARYEMGDPAGAFTHIRDAIRKGHRLTWEDAERLVTIYLSFNHTHDAIEKLQRLTTSAPDNALFAALLAICYERAGFSGLAVAQARRAAERDAGYSDGAAHLIRSIRIQELRASAVQWVRATATLTKEPGALDWLLATARYRRSDPEGAVELMRHIVEAGRRGCWRNGERLFLSNPSPSNARAAAALLKQLTEESPAADAFGPLLAFAQARAGDAEGAASTARGTTPTEETACGSDTWTQALTRSALEDRVDAWFARAEQFRLSLGAAYWMLAEARDEAGDTPGAVMLARLAIQHQHRPSWTGASWLVSAHNSLGEPQDTVRRLERIASRNPQQPVFFALLAMAHAQTGAGDAAVRTAEQAAALDRRYRRGAAALARQIRARTAPADTGTDPPARTNGRDKVDDASTRKAAET
jgi:tetratricopeptide (TPR) repeat protein